MSLHRPRHTLRLRLTLLYGAVFLASGAILLGITYFLVRQSTRGPVFSAKPTAQGAVVKGPHGPVGVSVIELAKHSLGGRNSTNRTVVAGAPAGPFVPLGPPGTVTRVHATGTTGPLASITKSVPDTGFLARGASVGPPGFAAFIPTLQQAEVQARQLQVLATQQHHDELHQLLVDVGIALAIMAVVSMGLGWLVAGRALRPLQAITKAARAISATNLHKRLSPSGPDDELRELGETFDELLERLERSFEAQRQFVANASHELRTPLTLERAIVEVTLNDPQASNETLRATCERVLAIGEQQERLIEALLTLARSERGLERWQSLDIAVLARELLSARRPAMARRELDVASDLDSARTSGDSHLVERLIANLLDNAVEHNVPGGWIKVSTGHAGDEAFIRVSNSGPVVPADEVRRLFEPFQRLGASRSARGDGQGLGLSIVGAIASAHDARVSTRPLTDGGLEIEVSFVGEDALDAAASPGRSLGAEDPGNGAADGAAEGVGSPTAS